MSDEKSSPDKLIPPADNAMLPPDYFRSPLEAVANRYYPGDAGAMDSLQLGELWRRIRKHQWLIVVIVVIVTSVVAVESYRTKSMYRAAATLQLDLENRTLFRSGDVSIESEESDNAYLTAAAMKTKIRLLQSRPLLEDVVANLQLDRSPQFMDVTQRKNMWESMQTIAGRVKGSGYVAPPSLYIESPPAPTPESLQTRTTQESARLSPYVNILSGALSAAQVEDTQMLTISYEHTNPTLAAQIVNTAAEFFVAHNFRNKTRRYNSTSGWLNTRTRDLKSRLEQAQQKLADFSSTHGISSPTSNEALEVAKLGKLHTQVMQAETERILKQSLNQEVQQGRLSQLPEAFADSKLTALQGRLNELSIQSSQYVGRFGPDNPRTQDVQKQIVALQRQLDEGRKNLGEKLKADYERAARDEQTLRAALERSKAETKSEEIQQNQANVQFGLLQQDVQIAKNLYTEFLQKTNQASVQLAEQHNNLQIIEPATMPVAPIGPNRFRIILTGFLLSLCFGIGLALTIEFFDDTVKTSDDVIRYVGLPTLAAIPAVLTQRFRLRGGGNKTTALVEGNTAQAMQRPLISQPGQMPGHSISLLTEAYRGLRTSILLSAAGTPPKVILFTSSQPGEGKTTTTVNTAISLAQMGLSVVVIDADLRRPSVHKAFGLDASHGMSSYLSQNIRLASLLQNTSVPCVSVLPCGVIPPNPTELISSEKMKSMVHLLKEHFDHVLIDSPPLTNVADSLVLSTLVDGVIVVVQSGASKRRAVQRVRRELMQVGAKIFGVVLNKVDHHNSGYYDYRYYANHYSSYTSDIGGEGKM